MTMIHPDLTPKDYVQALGAGTLAALSVAVTLLILVLISHLLLGCSAEPPKFEAATATVQHPTEGTWAVQTSATIDAAGLVGTGASGVLIVDGEAACFFVELFGVRYTPPSMLSNVQCSAWLAGLGAPSAAAEVLGLDKVGEVVGGLLRGLLGFG